MLKSDWHPFVLAMEPAVFTRGFDFAVHVEIGLASVLVVEPSFLHVVSILQSMQKFTCGLVFKHGFEILHVVSTFAVQVEIYTWFRFYILVISTACGLWIMLSGHNTASGCVIAATSGVVASFSGSIDGWDTTTGAKDVKPAPARWSQWIGTTRKQSPRSHALHYRPLASCKPHGLTIHW
jgi:hypothetical protein